MTNDHAIIMARLHYFTKANWTWMKIATVVMAECRYSESKERTSVEGHEMYGEMERYCGWCGR